MRELVIVSGLPRSGTSLLMSMLQAGGLPVLADEQRPPDQHNPKGYFESSRLLSEPDGLWLREHQGKAIKILYRQLENLSAGLEARILLMERDVREVVASQQRMRPAGDLDWANLFTREFRRFKGWLARQPWPVLRVQHRRLLEDCPAQVAEIQDFLAVPLDLQAMAAQVDPSLYRSRLC